jgi:hypothetical protein
MRAVKRYDENKGSRKIARENRIHIAGTEAFIKPEINHNGIMILDLNQTTRVSRGRRIGPEIG